ncbi:MAG TPA: ferrochelatase [Chloroflexota bacterium]|nr:ferrochelatase [Chloroflexota bacterium]
MQPARPMTHEPSDRATGGGSGGADPQRTLGVLLMTFGSPATLEDVPAYLSSVRGGRPVADDLVAEFQRRYRVIGGSPLLSITQAQAAAVERVLNEGAGDTRFKVGIGMRHAPPFIADGLAELAAAGARRIVAIIMSPQYSPLIMGGYHRAVEAASDRLGAGVQVSVAGAWHRHPGFLRALARRVTEALDRFPAGERDRVPVILTAHSLPKAVVDREPEYLEQLKETVQAVVALAGLDATSADGQRRWWFAYQSAGHTPEEWLKPDLKDVLPLLRAAGYRRVLVVPVQFLADHLEILYDIDVAARAEAEAAGTEFHRIESLNLLPTFIQALADVARAELQIEAPMAEAHAG